MGVILGIIVTLIGLALLLAMLRFVGTALKYALGISLGIAALVTLGLPLAYGMAVEAVSRSPWPRALLAWSGTALVAFCAFCWSVTDLHGFFAPGSFASLKYALSTLLLIVMLRSHRLSVRASEGNQADDWLRKKHQAFHVGLHGSIALLAMSAWVPGLFAAQHWSGGTFAAYAYWVTATLVQLYFISQDRARQQLEAAIAEVLQIKTSLDVGKTLKAMSKDSLLEHEEVETLFNGRLSPRIAAGQLREMEITGQRWVFEATWYRNRYKALHGVLLKQVRHAPATIERLVLSAFGYEGQGARQFIEQQMTFGHYLDFRDGRFWSTHAHLPRISCCTSCGLAEVRNSANDAEWFCSSTCAQTEQLCLSVRDKPEEEFLADAASTGFLLMAAASAWDANHKLFAAGGQGHGFAAEKANHRLDRLMGRSAEILGDNNAKNGADRLVQGQLIQTKYCSTAARSIGSAFDGQQGQYRYMHNGRPMQVEVPKDQYPAAVRTMQGKIRDNKVPGVTDPKDAVKLVRKGHLTYDQARNITKFGTFESIAYDIREGVVVGAVAGGISFGVSATLFYLKTQDRQQALRVATIQAGKSFGRSLTVYVATQQLHRVQLIQRSLNLVDVGALAPSTRSLLAKGMGVSKSGLNKALRGTLVSSIAVIAVTTGPDLVKLARGRISKAQFAKNLAVTSSGVAGGVIGSIAGGVIAAPLGPLGAMLGRTAGGIVGGIVASAISSRLMGKLIEEDRVRIIKVIQAQLEYLAVTFMLAKEELDSVNANLDKALTQESLEVIHAAEGNRRAMANFYLKPVVVAVVRQRPVLTFSGSDVVQACEDIAA